MRTIFKLCIIITFILLQITTKAQVKRLYISNDDHTDYMWTANEANYQTAFIDMLDWWIAHNNATSGNAPEYQSKWNCDGSFWISVYEKNKSAAEFATLISQINKGQITVPYNALITTYGAVPTEAVLRGMYYAGTLERRFGLDLDLALAMENQTLPLGLASLWKGAGAKYCWHGVCACATQMSGFSNRQNEIYWYKGLDTNKILLKWYNIGQPNVSGALNSNLGGYAEARIAQNTIDSLVSKVSSPTYPYNIAAGFGVGQDDPLTLNDNLITAAIANSNASQQVIVSNEIDFFKDFETTYGAGLPIKTQTFGNEWDMACAAIAEVSAKVKRSLEKLRAAEAMAAIVTNYNPTIFAALDSTKKAAWQAMGLFWEHSLGSQGNVVFSERNDFQRRLELSISNYTNQLYDLAKSNLANLISKPTSSGALPTFFAFNPLGWQRTDYADYEFAGSTSNIHIWDISANLDVPFQVITKNAKTYIRILAANIPSVGYKVYEIRNGLGTAFPPAGTDNGSYVIENDFFTVTYTLQGVITSIIDKQNANKQLVETGKYLNDLGSGGGNTGVVPGVDIGPVSITVSLQSNSPLAHTTKITLFKSIPRIDIDNQITQNFNATQTWTYSFNVPTPTVMHEELGAIIKAKLTTNASNQGDYAAQNARYDWNTLGHFASINQADGYGVTLSNQDCYFMKIGNSSVNVLDENSAQIKVLAGGQIDGLEIPNQGGDNIFSQRFAITTHANYNAAAEMKVALSHQDSMVCGTVYNPVNFLLPTEYSFVKSTAGTNSIIYAVKPTEDLNNRGITARVWNLGNSDETATINYNLAINEAKRMTHVETDIPSDVINFAAKDLFLPIGHNEMKTFRVKLNVIPLPVKLITFTGNKVQEVNELQWKATDEINLKNYELQRSTNGQQFITISNTAAKTGTLNNYNYTDKDINTTLPYYYRLKMINSDNTFSYSATIIIKAAKGADDLMVFPNPATDIIKVNLILDKQTRCTVSVINAAGMVVKTVAPPLFERGTNYYTLPIKNLPTGEYILSITAGDKKFAKSFFKK